jgi:hypothetical protein
MSDKHIKRFWCKSASFIQNQLSSLYAWTKVSYVPCCIRFSCTEDSGLVGCYVASLVIYFSTFRRTAVHSYSDSSNTRINTVARIILCILYRYENGFVLKKKVISTFETSRTITPNTSQGTGKLESSKTVL